MKEEEIVDFQIVTAANIHSSTMKPRRFHWERRKNKLTNQKRAVDQITKRRAAEQTPKREQSLHRLANKEKYSDDKVQRLPIVEHNSPNLANAAPFHTRCY